MRPANKPPQLATPGPQSVALSKDCAPSHQEGTASVLRTGALLAPMGTIFPRDIARSSCLAVIECIKHVSQRIRVSKVQFLYTVRVLILGRRMFGRRIAPPLILSRCLTARLSS